MARSQGRPLPTSKSAIGKEWQRAIIVGDIRALNGLFDAEQMPQRTSMCPALFAAEHDRADSFMWVFIRGYMMGLEVCQAAHASGGAVAKWLRDDCNQNDLPCRRASGSRRCPLHGYDGWRREHLINVWKRLRSTIRNGYDPAKLNVELSVLPQAAVRLDAETLYREAAEVGNGAALEWLRDQLPGQLTEVAASLPTAAES